MKKVFAFLADGFEETEAIFPIDLMRRAGIDVTTVSISQTTSVLGAHNIRVEADTTFDQIIASEADMLFLPGGAGHKKLLAHTGLIEAIKVANESSKWLSAICASPMIFGTLGLLNGKAATCFPGFEQYLAGAIVTGAPAEISGNIVTGRSAGAALQFALATIEALLSKEEADKIARQIVA